MVVVEIGGELSLVSIFFFLCCWARSSSIRFNDNLNNETQWDELWESSWEKGNKWLDHQEERRRMRKKKKESLNKESLNQRLLEALARSLLGFTRVLEWASWLSLLASKQLADKWKSWIQTDCLAELSWAGLNWLRWESGIEWMEAWNECRRLIIYWTSFLFFLCFFLFLFLFCPVSLLFFQHVYLKVK